MRTNPVAPRSPHSVFQVFVEVEDVNDHLPQTEYPVYRPAVPEDAPVGTTVLELRATDGDRTPSNLTFFISRSRRRRNGWMLQHPEGEEDAQEVFAVHKETGTCSTWIRPLGRLAGSVPKELTFVSSPSPRNLR